MEDCSLKNDVSRVPAAVAFTVVEAFVYIEQSDIEPDPMLTRVSSNACGSVYSE